MITSLETSCSVLGWLGRVVFGKDSIQSIDKCAEDDKECPQSSDHARAAKLSDSVAVAVNVTQKVWISSEALATSHDTFQRELVMLSTCEFIVDFFR